MGLKLLNHVKALPGFTPAEKSVLKELADLSRDDQTVFVSLEKLSLNTSYSVRSLQYTLHKLEQKQAIILQREARGRGNAHSYEFNVGFNDPVGVPVVPAPTNGHKPHVPTPPDVLVPDESSGLSLENQEFLQRVRKTLADRQEQQERYIQLNGQANPALQEWIERSHRQIEKLERRIPSDVE